MVTRRFHPNASCRKGCWN